MDVSAANLSSLRTFLDVELGSAGYEILPLTGDASNRRYFRVVFGDQSFVLMVWEPFVDNADYPFLGVLNHFAKHGVLVPKVRAKSPANGLVLLEDLGDLTLERKFWETRDQSEVIPFYRQAIDELIKIHFSATDDASKNCVAFRVAFDLGKLLWEMNYGREHLIEGIGQVNLTAIEKKNLDRIFNDICALLAERHRRICHRDYHSRNLMIKLGQMRVIDFQDARMGPIQYDLVSLVYDSYVDLSGSSRVAILNYYKEAALDVGASPKEFDDFELMMKIQRIQRCFKACGSFSSFYQMRKDTRYLKYISKTLKIVSDTIVEFPEYRVFYDILSDYGLLDRHYEVE